MSAIGAEAPIDVAALVRRLQLPVVVIVIAGALVTLLAIVGRQSDTAQLDPRNPAPVGAHALSVLLTSRGIPVTVVGTTSELSAAATTTIVVDSPGLLSRRALQAVARTAATVVLFDPSQTALRLVGIHATADADTAATTLDPACSLPAAATAGNARIAGDLYAAPTATSRCYLQQGDAALFVAPRRGGATTIVTGSPSTFTNAYLGHDGDAALALGLLNNRRIQWVTGRLDAGPGSGSQRGLFNLLPSRLLWAVLQLAVALIVVALWRARRLGPLVVEPLPVVVRAAETVEGRGRLMRAARSRGLAAAALRSATLERLRRSLGVGASDPGGAVVDVVAERVALPPAEVEAVLYGGEPLDDAALVRLAQQLPVIESAVRQDITPPLSPGAT